MNKSEKRRRVMEAGAIGVRTRTLLLQRSTDAIIEMASGMARKLKKGGIVYLAGNGGSAADCQHFAAELIVRLTGQFDRASLPAIALNADSAVLTAAGNDYGFEQVFARQVQSLVRKKDLLFLISTSGNSENLIMAAKAARRAEIDVYALLGGGGGRLKRYATQAVMVPSSSVQRIQEEQIFVIHSLVQLIEWDLFA